MLPRPIRKRKAEILQTDMFGTVVYIEDAGEFTIYPYNYSESYAIALTPPDEKGRVKLKIRDKIMTFNKPKLRCI